MVYKPERSIMNIQPSLCYAIYVTEAERDAIEAALSMGLKSTDSDVNEFMDSLIRRVKYAPLVDKL